MTATTPIYGFPYPEDTDPPDGPGQIQALAEAVESDLDTVDDRVDALEAGTAAFQAATADTGWVTTGFVSAAGYTPSVARYRKLGKLCVLELFIANSTGGAVTAGATGNIGGDPLIITIPAAARPASNVYGAFSASTTAGSFVLSSAGAVNIRDAHSGSSIANGDNIGITVAYFTA